MADKTIESIWDDINHPLSKFYKGSAPVSLIDYAIEGVTTRLDKFEEAVSAKTDITDSVAFEIKYLRAALKRIKDFEDNSLDNWVYHQFIGLQIDRLKRMAREIDNGD